MRIRTMIPWLDFDRTSLVLKLWFPWWLYWLWLFCSNYTRVVHYLLNYIDFFCCFLAGRGWPPQAQIVAPKVKEKKRWIKNTVTERFYHRLQPWNGKGQTYDTSFGFSTTDLVRWANIQGDASKKNIKRIKKNIGRGSKKILRASKKILHIQNRHEPGKGAENLCAMADQKKILKIHVEGRWSRNSLHSALIFSPDSFSCRGSFLRLFVSSSPCFLISSISSVPRVLLRTGSIYNVSIHIMNVFSLYER